MKLDARETGYCQFNLTLNATFDDIMTEHLLVTSNVASFELFVMKWKFSVFHI